MAAAEAAHGSEGGANASCPNSEHAAPVDCWPAEWCIDVPEVPSDHHQDAAGAANDALAAAISTLPKIELVTCVRERVVETPFMEVQEPSYASFGPAWLSPRSPTESPRLVRQSSQRMLDTGALVQLSPPSEHAPQEEAAHSVLCGSRTPRSRPMAGLPEGKKTSLCFPPRPGDDQAAAPDCDAIYRKVYKGFIEHIDGIDNGVEAFDSGKRNYEVSSTLSSRVGRLNPLWNQPQGDEVRNAKFVKGLQLTAQGSPSP